jgi:thiamine biosynthesis lipoprotein ApbE
MIRAGRWLALAALLVCGGCRREVGHVAWTEMGTVAAVRARGEPPAPFVARVRETFGEVARLLNAHDPSSELRRLAPLPDDEILRACSPAVRACYEAAFLLARETERAFNPRWRGPGTMDLGGIAKGFAVDLAARRAAREATGDALVDLGGNLRAVRGDWRVGIEGSDRCFVLRAGEACATSAEYHRGKHLRDGRTGVAVSNDLVSVTVVARGGDWPAQTADGLSTALFVLGAEKGAAFARRVPGVAVAWLFADGSVRADDGLLER